MCPNKDTESSSVVVIEGGSRSRPAFRALMVVVYASMVYRSMLIRRRPRAQRQMRSLYDSVSAPFPVLVLLLVLVGCASAPERIDQEAAQLGYKRIEVQGNGFVHVVYQKLKRTPDSVLHVYLEGDGTPWIRERWVADDPTPRTPLMLRLMALDAVDSVYVGRPCYHGLARTPPCQAKFWTSARYSREVVSSMATVVRRLLDARASDALCLFGHSGGGTLAMLLAAQLGSTRAVVTLAGNLDVQAWVGHHHYTPLAGSLDPARGLPLDRSIRQLHVIGSDDRVILPRFLDALAQQGVADNVVEVKGLTHSCCWEQVWPSVLQWVMTPNGARWRGPAQMVPKRPRKDG
nr:alpha/beta hydrolase [Gammaproteobacteria bacterium]